MCSLGLLLVVFCLVFFLITSNFLQGFFYKTFWYYLENFPRGVYGGLENWKRCNIRNKSINKNEAGRMKMEEFYSQTILVVSTVII